MHSLVIVGNGFDIAHGMKTSYSDFMRYLCQSADTDKRAIYDDMQKYIDPDDLWSSLETALSKIDFEQLEEDNSHYMVPYTDENWSDSYHHDYQQAIDGALAFGRFLPIYLAQWINSMEERVKPKFKRSVMNPCNKYLCFNYTVTLEEVYGVSQENICHIHGRANRGDTLILGHHDKATINNRSAPDFHSEEEKEVYNERMLGYDTRDLEGQEAITQYFKDTFKNTEDILKDNTSFFHDLKEIREVYVLGHSCSEVDYDYFREVCTQTGPHCEWFISYYSEEDCNAANKLAAEIGVIERCRIVPVEHFL